MATTINAGRVRFVSRGTYNNSTQYYLFDLVDYNGSSYIAKENTVGNLPTNTQYWQLIAEKGNTGSTGQTGPVGATGNGIQSITKTATEGLVDTYTITYTNGNTTTFTITNGEDGEVTETELDVLRQKVADQQKVIDQLPQVTGQGTSITLENTIEAQFTIFDVEGNSVQDGTPSPDNEVPIESAGDNENLFDIETSTAYQLCTKSDDVFTTSAMTRFAVPKIKLGVPLTVINGTDYYISYDVKTNSGDAKKLNYYGRLSEDAGLNITTNFGELIGTFTMSNSYQRVLWKTTATSDFTANYLFLQATSEITNAQTISIKNIKISEVNTTPYSPYGMGSINEKIGNKNLFDISNNTVTASGLTAIIENGIVSLGGTSTSTSFLFLIRNKLSLKAGTYTISTFNNNISSDATTDLRVTHRNGDGVIARAYLNNTNASFTFTLDTDLEEGCLQIRSGSGNTFNNFVIKPQLELGSSATSFVPHQEQDYSIFVQQPFRSIGDVRDCFVKKSDGWYERHNIGRKIFDGTENWIYLDSRGNYYRFYLINFSSGAGIKPVVSNFFIDRGNSAIGEYDFVQSSGNEFYLQIENKTSVAQLKNYLAEQYASGNPVYVDYLLAEPLDLPCTEEQIQQIENKPSTYKDFTIIQSEDETPAYLEVSGIYDLNKLINN